MLITPSFKKSLIVEQFQGNYPKLRWDLCIQVRQKSSTAGLQTVRKYMLHTKLHSLYKLLCTTTLNLSRGNWRTIPEQDSEHKIRVMDTTRSRSTNGFFPGPSSVINFPFSQTFIRRGLSATLSFKYKNLPFASFYPCRIPKSITTIHTKNDRLHTWW